MVIHSHLKSIQSHPIVIPTLSQGHNKVIPWSLQMIPKSSYGNLKFSQWHPKVILRSCQGNPKSSQVILVEHHIALCSAQAYSNENWDTIFTLFYIFSELVNYRSQLNKLHKILGTILVSWLLGFNWTLDISSLSGRVPPRLWTKWSFVW